ncbi:hepatic lectin-like [Penaeus japonicus]|uniref:hepatic lectin-like n=1 Tax=Penaeus japonicus TaxID=27405 RepID=UPI001C715FD8|nr:hepatic lectin-like [Penaeus japonicus]
MLEDLGCIYLSTTKRNWHESREDCLAYDADLFVASTSEQLHSLKNYYYNQVVRNYKWVGIIDRTWMDGRLAVDVWITGEPNGATDGTMCGVMRPAEAMDDTYCTREYEYVCQANKTTT